MKKSIKKIFKTTLAFSLVSAMCINTFAAIGANDGSAFVTKAEFDALVNTFNEQMDNYENSIVSKVDGAIANYLNSLSNERTESVGSIINNLDKLDRTFYNNSSITSVPRNGDTFYLKLCLFGVAAYSQFDNLVRSNAYEGYVRVNSYDYNSGASGYTIVNSGKDSNYKVKLKSIEKNGVKYYTPTGDGKIYYVEHVVNANGTLVLHNTTDVKPAYSSTTAWTVESNIRVPGEGGNSNANGALWNGWPNIRIFHNSTAYYDGTVFDFQRYLPGTAYSATLDKTYFGLVEANIDEFDSDSYLEVQGTEGSSSTNGPGFRWIEKPHEVNQAGSFNTRKDDTFTYKLYTQKVIAQNIYDWINYTATDLHTDVVKKSDGLPLCTVKEKGKIRIPLNLTNSVGKSTIGIKTSKWGKDAPIDSEKDDYAYFNASAGDALNITIEKNDNASTTYWLKVNPNNAGATCEVSLDGVIQHIIED